MEAKRTNYGIDAPGVIRNLAIAAVVCGGVSATAPGLRWVAWPAALCAVEAVWMIYASKVGKLHKRDYLLDRMNATLANAQIEGVSHKVDVRTADARALPMSDGSIDVVVSSLALHNISDAGGRAQAIREAVRVLKPGGAIAIQDIFHTGQYMKVLEECGMDDVRRTVLQFRMFPPTRIVRAEKVQ